MDQSVLVLDGGEHGHPRLYTIGSPGGGGGNVCVGVGGASGGPAPLFLTSPAPFEQVSSVLSSANPSLALDAAVTVCPSLCSSSSSERASRSPFPFHLLAVCLRDVRL